MSKKKQNKRVTRKKANIKKRNLQRVARQGQPDRKDPRYGLSLADAGANDIMEVLTWSRLLANDPEFDDPMFDPVDCLTAFNEQTKLLGLDDTEAMPKEVYAEKQADLTLATVEAVLTKAHQKEITSRLKKARARYNKDGVSPYVSRIDILLSLLDFSKDEKVWGTLGLVSALVMKQVQEILLLMTFIQSIEVEDGATSLDGLMQQIEAHPEHARILGMVERNPKLRDFLTQRLDRDWYEGVSALENGKLQLRLFDQQDYAYAEDLLSEIELDDGTYDAGQREPFLDKLNIHLKSRLGSAQFVEEIQSKLQEILDKAEVEPQYMPFVLRLQTALSQLEWLERYGADVLVHALLADLQQEDAGLDEEQ